MAGYKYYTILTDVGKQKLVEAIANETALDFTEIAIGDANGVSYDPTGEETALKHIVFKKAIDSVSIDAVDKNIMIFEMVVPASSGGYYMREAGLFSSDGSLIAIARIAEQYKPLLSEGAGAIITISMRIAVSSEAQVYINIPESINYATQNYVKEEFKKHITNSNPHEQYVLNETYSDKINELQENIAGKAASNHNHDDLYSNINHTHSNYALTSHNHDNTYLKKTDASSTYATKSELNTGLAGKAASNHNHDGTYSKTNHTHAGYAASNHSHAFSAITGSMAITDSRLTGNLPVARVTGAAGKPTHYTTSAGDWIETPLSDGKILLEGWGVGYNDTSDYVLITLPKTCVSIGNIISSVSIYGVVSGSCGYAGLGLTTEAFKGFCTTSNSFNISVGTGKKLLGYTWQFQGILA